MAIMNSRCSSVPSAHASSSARGTGDGGVAVARLAGLVDDALAHRPCRRAAWWGFRLIHRRTFGVDYVVEFVGVRVLRRSGGEASAAMSARAPDDAGRGRRRGRRRDFDGGSGPLVAACDLDVEDERSVIREAVSVTGTFSSEVGCLIVPDKAAGMHARW